ncbi:lysine-specific demethylase 2A-like isoform X2 [Physella acuta]|uniref:lysine-specific demethylase 2A-like isoform X2 n=1 Tax=Physella acuta TaxID=109671 RepID=UPI0027DDAA3A|nr:lysine-specific demethylase 2A-like isoform X2 [Physella acuta]
MAEDSETGRKLRAKERKKYSDQEIDEDDIDGRRMYSVEEKLTCESFNADMVHELKGPEFTMEWLQKNGLVRPIVFLDKTGLGLRVPSENFKVSDVKRCVGSRRILDVMDVNTQKALEMSMKDWVKYYECAERDRLLNVISLEFCHTRLENYVDSPTLVRQVDWVDRAWPRHLKECQTESTNVIEKMKYPKVQKYCLMSVAGCYTDFHIDFGGTSVWYHILHGEKIFWLAPPSQKNIDKYTEWTLSAKQGDSFLGDSLEQCQRIQLRAGNTFIIPSGWIHAVYTPKDSLVFGGNFLHSFNIENQLLVSHVEDKTHVPPKFRYPFFSEIMWYVVDRYLSCLTGRTYLSSSEKEEFDEDDQGLIQVDDDSRPPSRNPDSRPPSRAMDDSMDTKIKSESGEDTPKLSKSVTIELTRIDQALRRSQSEDENQPPSTKPRARKAVSDSNSSWEGGGGNRKWIHLTSTELKGLKQLVDYLSGLMNLPPNKRGVPREMLDPEAVLREIRQVLEEHKNDDQELAITGEPVIGWPESAKKKQQKLKLGYKTFKTAKTAKGSSSSSSIRRRRTRCKKCEACTREECGECTFCKDMKKFGGPGRMKQTCISRQCMAPILPSSSVCMICNQEGKANPDDLDDISYALMECGICWEIVHPSCLQKKYENLDNEGVVNEDLPNSWECSKCCNEGKQGQLKPRVRPGISAKKIKLEEHRFSADSDGTPEEEPISPISPVEGKRVVSKEGGGPKNWLSGEVPFVKTEPGAPKWPSPPKKVFSDVKIKVEDGAPSPQSTVLSPLAREDSQKKKPNVQKDQKRLIKKEKITSPDSPSNQEGGTKHSRKRVTTPGSSGDKNSDAGGKRPKREGPLCVAGDGPMGNPARDNQHKALDDLHSTPVSKKPKVKFSHNQAEGESGPFSLESAASSFSLPFSSPTSSQTSFPPGVMALVASSSPSLTGGASSANTPQTSDPTPVVKEEGKQICSTLENNGSPTPGPCPDKLRWGTDYAPKVPLKNYVVRPAPPSNIPEFVPMSDGSPHPLSHTLWTLIFRYLPQSDLVTLSAVCRTFDCWALDPSLWYQINLSRKSIKQVHLKGTMLRQPRSLKLASSVISYAQLSWLIARLPGLRHLDLSNLSWASICALCSSDCPLLRSLNLSWATGIRDLCFRELASPPVNLKPGQRNISRLSRLERLSLTGTDINDQSLEVIATHLPKLMALDLTCCMRVTDRGIRALVQLGGPCHLREIRLVKCVQLTERCLDSLAMCRELSYLALTDIPAITQEDCIRFSRNYKHRILRAHAQGIISI